MPPFDPEFLAYCRTLTDAELAQVSEAVERLAHLDPTAHPRRFACRMERSSRLLVALGSDGVVHCVSEPS